MKQAVDIRQLRVLAVDVDGTLTVPGTNEVPEQVLAALRQFVSTGRVLVLATGKKFTSVKCLCESLELRGPLIACNGSLVHDAQSGRILKARFLPSELYVSVLEALAPYLSRSVAVFTESDIVCCSCNYASHLLTAIGEPTTRFVASLRELAQEPVAKILVAPSPPAELRQVKHLLIASFGDRLSVTITSELFVEVMAGETSKGAALKDLADGMGFTKDQIGCIGDSDNDLSMFAVSGLRIAVANASRAVLMAADIVVPSALDGGAAEAVYRTVAGRQQ